MSLQSAVGEDVAPLLHVTNEDRFAAIPEALLYDARISADAVRVYGVLRRHGDDPTNCYPSHARVAALVGRSPRSINGWIRELEEAGWIERVPRPHFSGDWDSNSYRIFMVRRVDERGVRVVERGGVRATQRGGYAPHSAHNESKKNESKKERTTRDDCATQRAESTAHFEEHFWPAYPARDAKKVGKAKALTEWLKLSLDDQRAALRGARNYAASGWRAKDAERWLRDRLFEDWQTPAKPSAATNGNGHRATQQQARLDNIAELEELLSHERS